MDLVCDTNIWYGIAYDEIDPAQLKQAGHRLLATPVSLLELTSNKDPSKFKGWQKTAKALSDYADDILPDPEHHLANLWQITSPVPDFDWQLGINALANAKDFDELKSGVIDQINQKRVKVDTAYATTWRVDRYDRFVDDMISLIDFFWPGYKSARLSGKAIHMPRKFGEMLDKATSYPEQFEVYVLGTYARALGLPQEQEIENPNDDLVNHAMQQLLTYARIYQKYVIYIATVKPPEPNDLGDLECFLYAQDGRRVFTNENKWIQLAKDAGCEDSIFEVPAS